MTTPVPSSSNQKTKHTQVWKPVSGSSTEDQNPSTDDSVFFQAKKAQLVERNPDKVIDLFKHAIHSGDRVDSALKDMAYVMRGLGRTDDAIKAIKFYRSRCSPQSLESLDNVLIDIYKQAGRIDEHIALLQQKLKLIEEGSAFGGTGTKIVKVGRRELHVPIEREKSRLLGNLAWLYMKKKNYHMAEPLLRDALNIEPDKNKECNLAICLMYRGRFSEARSILQAVRHSSEVQGIAGSYIRSYNRAWKILTELESQSVLNYPPHFLHYPPPRPSHHLPQPSHHLPQHHFPPHHLRQPSHHLPRHHFPPHHLRQPSHHLPQHHFLPHHFPTHYLPPHHLPQPSHPPPQHHFLPHHLPPHHLPQPSHPPPQPSHHLPQHHFPPHHLPQHPQPSHPPLQPSPPPHPAIFDVNPMVSPYDDFDNQYSFMSAFRGLEMVPWRRRGT